MQPARFIHLFDKSNPKAGGLCIMVGAPREIPGVDWCKRTVSMALCHKGDHYDRKLARKIATGRSVPHGHTIVFPSKLFQDVYSTLCNLHPEGYDLTDHRDQKRIFIQLFRG